MPSFNPSAQCPVPRNACARCIPTLCLCLTSSSRSVTCALCWSLHLFFVRCRMSASAQALQLRSTLAALRTRARAQVSDMKLKGPSFETLTVIAEAVGPHFVASMLHKRAAAHKNPKVRRGCPAPACPLCVSILLMGRDSSCSGQQQRITTAAAAAAVFPNPQGHWLECISQPALSFLPRRS